MWNGRYFFSLLLLRKEIISILVSQYHEDKKNCQTSNISLDIVWRVEKDIKK